MHRVATGILCVVVALSAQAVAQEQNGDLKKLAGAWFVVSEEFRGQPRPREAILESKATLTVTGDKFVFEQVYDGVKLAHKGLWCWTNPPSRNDLTGTAPAPRGHFWSGLGSMN